MSLAFDSSGNIVVAEAGNGRVQFLRPDGTSEMVIDGAVGTGQLSGSSSAWVGSDGSLLVADSAKDRIVKIQLPI